MTTAQRELPEQAMDVNQIPQEHFGFVMDPFRPTEVHVPMGLQQRPPSCPTCRALLYSVSTNPKGDVLLSCQNDGYQTVWRAGTGQFEPRPGDAEGWVHPAKVKSTKQPVAPVSSGKQPVA